VSFIGDYRHDAKNSFTQTPAPKPSNLFSAYQSKNENQTENTTTAAAAQVIFFKNISGTIIYFLNKFFSLLLEV